MNANSNEKIQKLRGILFEQQRKISCEHEKRLIQIREATRYIYEELFGSDAPASANDVLSACRKIREDLDGSFGFHEHLLPEHKRKIGRALSSLHCIDKASLAEALSQMLKSAEHSLDAEDLLSVCDEQDAVICYVKNIHTDRAYDEFSSCFYESRVLYARNFDEACEQMRRKNASYCILPIYSDEAGELVSTRRLLDTYMLKICAVCEIDTEGASTRYALISEKNAFILDGDEQFFEFSVSVDGACDVEDLLYATELYGFSLASLKIEKSEVGMSCRISLLQREGDLFALLVYLLIFFEDYNVYGLYSNI